MRYKIGLSREEEAQLSETIQSELKRIRRKGETPEQTLIRESSLELEAARDKLVKSCIPWALEYSRRYNETGSLETDDIRQAALCGLMSAVLRFHSSKARLTTYATWWIRQAINRAIRSESHMIRIPEGRLNLYSQELLEPEEMSRLTKILGAGVHPMIEEVPQAKPRPDLEVMAELTRLLTKRERVIILGRYFEKITLDGLGRKLCLSRERIRQIQNKALEKLRTSHILEELFDECT